MPKAPTHSYLQRLKRRIAGEVGEQGKEHADIVDALDVSQMLAHLPIALPGCTLPQETAHLKRFCETWIYNMWARKRLNDVMFRAQTELQHIKDDLESHHRGDTAVSLADYDSRRLDDILVEDTLRCGDLEGEILLYNDLVEFSHRLNAVVDCAHVCRFSYLLTKAGDFDSPHVPK